MLKRVFVVLVMALVLFAGRVSWPAVGGGTAAQAAGPARFLVSLVGAPGSRDIAAANAARVHEVKPLLEALRQQGAILRYSTNAADGTAVIEGTASSLRRLRRTFGADVAPLSPASGAAHAQRLRRLAAASGVTAGGGSLTGNYSIGGSYVSGQGPAETFVDGVLQDASGATIARARVKSDENGYYGLSFVSASYPNFYPGFTIKLKAGSASLTLKVPVLTAEGNRVTDVVKGRGPKNAALIVTATHYIYNETGSTSTQFPLAVLANAQGNYSLDFTAFTDLIGNDSISVKYIYPESPNYVSFSTEMPNLYAYLDRTDVGGSATPGAATVVVKNRGGAQIFSMPIKVEWDHDWSDDLTNGVASVVLHPLMTIAVPTEQGVSAKLPKLTAQLKRSAKTVSGRGPANLPYVIYENEPYQTYYGRIGADGRYTKDISSAGPFTVNTRGYIYIYLPSGDVVYGLW